MDNIKLGENIRKFREHHELSLQQLADGMSNTYHELKSDTDKDRKFNKSSITRWESGDTDPSFTAIRLLSIYFKVSIEDLVNGNIENGLSSMYQKLNNDRQQKVLNFTKRQLSEQNRVEDPYQLSDNVEVDFYGYVSAGGGEYLSDERVEKITIKRDVVPKSKYDLVLRVNGDSMKPTFEHGEYVFVKRDTEVRNGQFAVFIINGDSYLKKVYVQNNRLILVSLNESYVDLLFNENDNIKLVGTVVL